MSLERPTQSQNPEKSPESAEKREIWEKIKIMSPEEFDTVAQTAQLTDAEKEAFSFARDMDAFQERATKGYEVRDLYMLSQHPNLSKFVKIFQWPYKDMHLTDMPDSEKEEMRQLYDRVGSWTQEDMDHAFEKVKSHLA